MKEKGGIHQFLIDCGLSDDEELRKLQYKLNSMKDDFSTITHLKLDGSPLDFQYCSDLLDKYVTEDKDVVQRQLSLLFNN